MLLTGLTSTALAGRAISRTGRYKVFPVVGLGLVAAGLLGLSRLGTGTSLVTTGLVLAVFGIGFGLVTQVLTIAIHGVGAGEVASALHTVFLIGAPVALLGLLVVLALREIPLRTA
jgi:hypothetical protein